MPQCTATTLKGARCKNNDEHHTLCHVHRKDVTVKHSSVKKTLKGCVEQFVGRYVNGARKSPSFPANECHGEVMVGRDGLNWVSKATSAGVYRWVKLK